MQLTFISNTCCRIGRHLEDWGYPNALLAEGAYWAWEVSSAQQVSTVRLHQPLERPANY